MLPRPAPYALLAMFVLLVPALSGCLVAQATAMENQDEAQDLAQDWDPEARLIHIMGMEGSGEMASQMGAWEGDPGGEEAWSRAEDDDSVGDGHAEVWGYHFRNGAGTEDLIILLDRDGKEIHRETGEPEDDAAAIGDYEVDSDEALEKAKEANDGVREGTGPENYGIMMVLGRDSEFGDNPVWLIMAGGGDAAGGGGGMVALDAMTGEVLAEFGGPGGMGGGDWRP